MIGCGDVTEVKSGPGFRKAAHSALVAVTRRDRQKAEDYARRHGVPKVHASADALIHDPEVDIVYVATPPSSHYDLSLQVAAAGKPCLVEKPMALDYTQCAGMVEAFRAAGRSLWVAYYRRALPRFQLVRGLLAAGAVGRPTSIQIEVMDRLAAATDVDAWRFDASVAGAGLFFDLGSHCFDLVDFLVGRITEVSGYAVNTGRRYSAEDVTGAAFHTEQGVVGTGVWNFNASRTTDAIVVEGSEGELRTPVFADGDVVVRKHGVDTIHPVRNPPHVHQPLVQSIVDELRGTGRCESPAETAARTSWVMDRCVAQYYGR